MSSREALGRLLGELELTAKRATKNGAKGRHWAQGANTIIERVRAGLATPAGQDAPDVAMDEEWERDLLERGSVEVGMTEGGNVAVWRAGGVPLGTGDTIAEATRAAYLKLKARRGGAR